MDTDKLILAAKIREVAVSLRETERHQHSVSLRTDGAAGVSSGISLSEWDGQNPLFRYFPRAIHELNDIAKLADSLKSIAQ